jgi:Rha family phage regulatory protein
MNKENALEEVKLHFQNDDLGVDVKNGKAMVSSLRVAEKFGKRHDNIVRDIENLEITENFRLLNFEASEYLNSQGKRQPMVMMTFEGFMFLVMGFTGKKASELKIAFITAFRKMEEAIRRYQMKDSTTLLEWGQARLEGKRARRTLTDIIKGYLIPAAISAGSQNADKLYMTYSRLLKETFIADPDFAIPKGDTVMDYLSASDLVFFKRLEDSVAKRIHLEVEKGTHYKEIYRIIKKMVLTTLDIFGKTTPELPKRGPVPMLSAAIN